MGHASPVNHHIMSSENMSANAMRHTLVTVTPMRLLATSHVMAAMVHEKATPKEMISPKYCMCIIYVMLYYVVSCQIATSAVGTHANDGNVKWKRSPF